ncbi:LLM class flavin-dependent oxidoreductase [Nonomuraea jiangxiensis]|uniref:Luciferase-like monooxygenase n=1 Tax=Nonomuraea jiangxiensis TaxID=633440 RepID=A0A1G7ZVS6_9ACTN|nr:LLM class flavin-dependent oxidoreductase [Nonomuraea jiangxiensis]SDH12761.1 Luciferase-like monooxygenase [Nonomuraea jiangxiensis]
MLDLSVLVLPDRDPAAFVADVRRAEDTGVRTVWTYDHLTWTHLKDRPWHAAVPMLAAAAVATSRVRLGTQVATPNYRHPVTFAKELMTLDHLSGGRLEVGVGAGAEGPDAAVLGDPPRSLRERAERFEEWLELLDHLLTHEISTVRGTLYSAVEARQIPGCVQRPRVPLTVAAAGPRALRLAAWYGQSWISYGPYRREDDPDAWYEGLDRQGRALTTALDAAGRPAAALRRIAQVPLDMTWPFDSADRYADFAGRLRDLGFDEVSLHWPRADDLRGMPSGALDFVTATHHLAER